MTCKNEAWAIRHMATSRHRLFWYDEKVGKVIRVLPNCNGHETGCRAVSFSTLSATSTCTFLPAMEADAAGNWESGGEAMLQAHHSRSGGSTLLVLGFKSLAILCQLS